MKWTLTFLLFLSIPAFGQNYAARLAGFREAYVQSHEVVKGEDRKLLRFFPVDPGYRVTATFTPVKDGPWLEFKTSGAMKQTYRVYGKATFRIHDTLVTLNIYQSQMLLGVDQYKDYLFLPFTDATTGVETYAAGRYIDLKLSDISNGKIEIDFNKAYNPYCAYAPGYSCPIPPKENALPLAVRAGEMNWAKHP